MINVDFVAGKHAPNILNVPEQDKSQVQSSINQALGILAEQGPYALLLWAYSKNPQDNSAGIGNTITRSLLACLHEVGMPDLRALYGKDLLRRFNQDICSNFLRLVLARQIFDRTLTYARYYARAESD